MLALTSSGGLAGPDPVYGPLGLDGPKLLPAGAVADAGFGNTLAVSADGATALVAGARDADSLGAVWVYERTGSGWTERQKLVPPDGSRDRSEFGTSVALSADATVALIGGAADNGYAGSAWIYTRSGSTWTEAQKLDAPTDSVGWSYFGTSVAASSDGTTVAIGAPRDGWLPASGGLQRGAAWIYARSGSTWSEQQKFTSPLTDEWGTEFGAAVALAANGDRLLVGAPVQAGGAVWAYTRSGPVWSEAQELTPAVPGVNPPAFGRTIALSADSSTAVIGGPLSQAFSGAPVTGAAWVFSRTGGSWIEQARLTAPDGDGEFTGQGNFGTSVAISADGSVVAAGAPERDNGLVGESRGGAWIFARSGSVWTRQQWLDSPSPGTAIDRFGGSVALGADGASLLVGSACCEATNTYVNDGRGIAWSYTSAAGAWTKQQTIAPPTDETPNSAFGGALAISADGTAAIVGGAADNFQNGAVWFLARSGSNWSEQRVAPADAHSALTSGIGTSVAISADGNTAAFSAPFDGVFGAVWVYTRTGSTCTEQQKIAAPPDRPAGSTRFGTAIALSGDGSTLLVGSDEISPRVYVRSGGTWLPQQALPGTLANGFRVALSYDGDTALVQRDGVVVYTRSAATWTLQQEIPAPADGDGSSGFGADFELTPDGSTALIGGPADGGNHGALWVFARSGSTWSEAEKVAPPSAAAAGGQFGSSVAIAADGATALIGGFGTEWLFTRAGSTWREHQKLATPPDEESVNWTVGAVTAHGATALVGSPNEERSLGAVWSYSAALLVPPGAPTGVAATAGNELATVSFDAPASNGGGALTYTVTAEPGGQTASDTSSPIVVTGLTNGTSYSFTVTATNAAGTGPASDPSAPVVPAMPAREPPPDPPGPVARPPVPMLPFATGPRTPPPAH